jgi:hypothetical protein
LPALHLIDCKTLGHINWHSRKAQTMKRGLGEELLHVADALDGLSKRLRELAASEDRRHQQCNANSFPGVAHVSLVDAAK